MIDGDIAKLVDQHRRVGQRRLPQQLVEQRRLAGSQEAVLPAPRKPARTVTGITRRGSSAGIAGTLACRPAAGR